MAINYDPSDLEFLLLQNSYKLNKNSLKLTSSLYRTTIKAEAPAHKQNKRNEYWQVSIWILCEFHPEQKTGILWQPPAQPGAAVVKCNALSVSYAG
jgi:hypothetical protein